MPCAIDNHNIFQILADRHGRRLEIINRYNLSKNFFSWLKQDGHTVRKNILQILQLFVCNHGRFQFWHYLPPQCRWFIGTS